GPGPCDERETCDQDPAANTHSRASLSGRAHDITGYVTGSSRLRRDGAMLAAAMNGPPRFGACVALSLCVILAGCGSASVSATREVGATPGVAPPTVYVRDFDLDAATIKAERGVLPPPPPPPPGPLGRVLPAPPGAPTDAAGRARELIELMSNALVDDLAKAGLVARRLRVDEAAPARGWLVRGI